VQLELKVADRQLLQGALKPAFPVLLLPRVLGKGVDSGVLAAHVGMLIHNAGLARREGWGGVPISVGPLPCTAQTAFACNEHFFYQWHMLRLHSSARLRVYTRMRQCLCMCLCACTCAMMLLKGSVYEHSYQGIQGLAVHIEGAGEDALAGALEGDAHDM